MAGLPPELEAAAAAPAVRLPGRFRDAELPVRWLLIPAGLLVLYLAFPVLRLLWAGAPGLAGALLDPAVRQSLLVTFVTAAAATAMGLVLAAPLGYVLARRRFRG
ncbi:MAG: hypothetical protein ACRD2F_10810, partial [Terriglobales bacterium]